jgi:hypothetical protein
MENYESRVRNNMAPIEEQGTTWHQLRNKEQHGTNWGTRNNMAQIGEQGAYDLNLLLPEVEV